jgi:hypothetical protein
MGDGNISINNTYLAILFLTDFQMLLATSGRLETA